MGKCMYCGNNAGILRGKHKACERTRDEGWQEMVNMVKVAARDADLGGTDLVTTLAGVAQRSWLDVGAVRASIVEGWCSAVRTSLANGVLTEEDEVLLRAFRDRMALGNEEAVRTAESELEKGIQGRLATQARFAALNSDGNPSALEELSAALDSSGLQPSSERAILVSGWTMAVSSALEDNLLSVEEETSLVRYSERFNLRSIDLNHHGAYTTYERAIMLREIANGNFPDRREDFDRLPMNFQKSEQVVWVFKNVHYYEVKTRRRRIGSSHGVSVRVAKGMYYSPRTYSSETEEWDETVYLDTGLLALTTKHIYFHGNSKRFRVRYDRIVSFDRHSDGIGIMRDAQTAKPQSFLIGDGWFAYNLVTNLAKMA